MSASTPAHAAPAATTERRDRTPATGLRRVPPRWRWTGIGALVFALACCWSLVTPLMSSPDEPSHVVRAAGVVRGQVSLELQEPQSDGPTPGLAGRVELPSDFADAVLLPNCLAFQPTVSAACQDPLPPADGVAEVDTFAGQYPPLYYALVGWPSLLLSGESGILAMRLMSALLTSALVTWGLFRLTRVEGNRAGVWGAAIALTPMCLFLGATVNPAGFEVNAAFAFWTACLALVLGRGSVPTSALVQAVVAGALLVNTRSTGPVWALAIAVVALVAAPAGRWRAILRHPRIWWFAAATALACAAGAAWLLTHPSVVTTQNAYPDLASPRAAGLIVIGLGAQYLLNMIGEFGWFDSPAPPVTVMAWYAMTGVVLLLGLAARRAPRRRLAVLLLVLGTAAAPLVLQVPTAADTGVIWQGRYALPLAIGVPLLAALVVGIGTGRTGEDGRSGEDDLVRRIARGTLPVILVGHVAAFYWAARRYAEGLDGHLLTWHPEWSSPIGFLPGTALYALLGAALALCGWVYYREPRTEPGTGAGTGTDRREPAAVPAPEPAAEDSRAAAT